jgi:hypothetical protein
MFPHLSIVFQKQMTIPEAKIQQEAERAWRSQIGARSGKAARSTTLPGPVLSGGAHPPSSPLSPRFPVTIPWHETQDVPVLHHEHSVVSKGESSGQRFLLDLTKIYKY